MRLRNSSHVLGTFWDEWSQWCNRLLPTKRRWPLCCFCGKKSGGEKMARKEFLSATQPLALARSRTVLLVACVALAVLVACGVAAVAALEPAKAAFPGTNGKIAFLSDRDHYH